MALGLWTTIKNANKRLARKITCLVYRQLLGKLKLSTIAHKLS